MKIVDYNTFTNMPKGTIYSVYEPCYFSNPKIKHDVISHEKDGFINDWFYQELINNPDWDEAPEYGIESVCKELENGKSIKPDFNCITRDAMFDYDRKFLIYEKEDIQLFIDKLQSLL
jgi:hypothetical protein